MEQSSEAVLVEQGRRFVRIATAILVLATLAATAIDTARHGTSQLAAYAVRMVLLFVLAVGLVRGGPWARWLTVALLLGAIMEAGQALGRLAALRPEPRAATVLALAAFLGYSVIAHRLVYSASVRAFFRAHRRPRPDPSAPAS
jgi:hypothetical protein